MDCRTFRHHHCAFVDDVLPGADVVAMERHRMECEACAAFDAKVRRSLLVIRNLPPIECSADFTERLFRRLRETEMERRPTVTAPRARGRAVAAVAASMLLAAGGAFMMADDGGEPVLVLPPVVAMNPPPPPPEPLAGPVIAASASAGVPMWPALLLADELPMQVMQQGWQQGWQQVGLR